MTCALVLWLVHVVVHEPQARPRAAPQGTPADAHCGSQFGDGEVWSYVDRAGVVVNNHSAALDVTGGNGYFAGVKAAGLVAHAND